MTDSAPVVGRVLDSPEWWSAAIADRYFSPAFANEPVMLSVDEYELNSIAGTTGTGGIDALAGVVQAQVMPGHRFNRVGELMKTWKAEHAADTPPPCLPLLAINVIAASYMDTGGEPGAPSFYRPLRRLLDPADGDEGMPPTYDDFVPQFWEDLKSWLENEMENGRGIPTIERHHHHVNIGYAKQQSLVRAADRRLIYRFFHALQFDPIDDCDIAPSELRRSLGLWASRRGSAGHRLQRLATDTSVERYAESLLPILMKQWDGRIQDLETGAPGLAMRLVIPSHPSGDPILQLVAFDEKSVLPPVGTLAIEGGQHLVVERTGDGVFQPDPLPIEVDDLVLREGLTISGDAMGFFFTGAEAFAFRRADEPLYPEWVSTRKLRFGEDHLLLVQRCHLQEMRDWLAADPNAHGELEPEATRLLPNGWFLFRSVRLDARPSRTAPTAIADLLSTAGGSRTQLTGGLRIEGMRHVYLEGGSPLLALADVAAPDFIIHHEDHAPLKRTAIDGEFALGDLPIPEGHIVIEHEGRSIAYDLVSGLSEQPDERSVGSVLLTSPSGRASSGLLVNGPGPLPPSVVSLPAGPAGIVIGPATEDVALLQLPIWLDNELGYESSWTSLDVWGAFVPSWFLEHTSGGYIAYPLSLVRPQDRVPGSQWARILRSATLCDGAGDATQRMWTMYSEAAT